MESRERVAVASSVLLLEGALPQSVGDNCGFEPKGDCSGERAEGSSKEDEEPVRASRRACGLVKGEGKCCCWKWRCRPNWLLAAAAAAASFL